MKRRLGILMPVLVTLVLLISAFAMATPAMAADVALTKGVTPASPNMYRLGDTIYFTMSIANDSASEDIVVEAVWDILPDGSTVYPTGPALPYNLAPGASQSYSYAWVASMIGIVVNTFYASGYQISTFDDPFNLDVTKSSLVINPSIEIVKYVNGDDANSPPGPAILVGDPANFTYEVTNTGDSDLDPVVVVDDNGTPGVSGDDFNPTYTGGDDTDGKLNPLETWYYSYTGTAAAGQHTNIATATGTPLVGPDVSDTDPANYNQPPPVGGEAYPVSRLAILAPWIALALGIFAGASLLLRRRRRA